VPEPDQVVSEVSRLIPCEGRLAGGLAVAALALARRFAAGATMWCVSPSWPCHGSHVAVEFVHPVIVGKRALPAVHVQDDDLIGAVRLLSRPGDILLGIGDSSDEEVAAVVRRGEAWGLTTVWIGARSRPATAAADHELWIGDADMAHAARSGEVVLCYHLLWELTQVVFEHSGLLGREPERSEEVCITCSDEGRLAEVRSSPEADQALVVSGGQVETVDVSLVDGAQPGDLVLVHAGVAVARLPEGGRD
jgi:hydrogenase maturation factor